MNEEKGQAVAYIRVSTAEQNDARQIEALKPYGISRKFIDRLSGKDRERPQLQEMLAYIRAGDTVYVTEFSRLGRSTMDLLEIVQEIEKKGAKLISIKEDFDTSTPHGRFQMTMLAAIAQFEREMILERQREGIYLAKQAGKYKGRKRIEVPDIGDYYNRYMSRQTTKTAVAKELGISRNTVDRLFKEYEKETRAK